MTLTTDQKAYIRDNSGAPSDGDYAISDATLQTIYDDAEQGNSSLNRTIVWALRRLVGKTAKKITKSDTEGRTENLEQLHDHFKALLAQWESIAGMSGGLTIGRSATNTYRADSLQTEEPDYSGGTGDDERSITVYY